MSPAVFDLVVWGTIAFFSAVFALLLWESIKRARRDDEGGGR